MAQNTNQDYIKPSADATLNLEQDADAKLDQILKNQSRSSLSKQNYKISLKTSRWLWTKRTAIILLVLSIGFGLSFILGKYLNYYFNFGPMDSEMAARFSIDWFNPFTKWNWDIVNDFQNYLTPIANGDETINVIVVQDLFWNGAPAGEIWNVTRDALIGNNFANAMLYIAAPTALGLGLISLLAHFLIGKPKAHAVMDDYIASMKLEAIKEYKLLYPNSGSSKTIINNKTIYMNDAANKGSKNDTLVEEKIVKKVIVEPVVVEEPVIVQPKVVEQKPVEQKIVTTTHIHKIEPETIEVENHIYEKPDSIAKVKKVKKTYPSIGKNDLIDEIYNDLKGTLTVKQLNEIYDATFESIVEEINQNPLNDVAIFNFGKFKTVEKIAHEGINPLTGEKIWIDAKTQLKFGPSSSFKKTMEEAEIKETTKTVKKTVKLNKAGKD